MMEYDNLCRFTWAERSRQNVDGFDVNVTCLGLDKHIRDQAEGNVQKRLAANKKTKGDKVFGIAVNL